MRKGTLFGILAVLAALALGTGLAACGDDDDDDGDETSVVGGSRQPESGEEAAETELTGAALGEQVFADQGCTECHVLGQQGGTGHGTGPALGGVFGSQVALADGGKVEADEEYIARAIEDPDAEISKGFQEGVMSAAIPPGSLDQEQVDALVAYIRTLR